MKIVTYSLNNKSKLGLFVNNKLYDVKSNSDLLNFNLPDDIYSLLADFKFNLPKLKLLEFELNKNNLSSLSGYTLLSPVPKPNSLRDAYAFRQHVETSRRNRNVAMIPEFDQFPVFYFGNHNSIIGEGNLIVEEDHLKRLDFELEIAIVIGKRGKNILAKDSDKYIAGFTIMNDFSARQLQMEEMKLNLGPAKGKDFATALGPYLTTLDELADKKILTEKGNKYDFEMKAYHNDKLISQGNFKDINWTFAEIIERVSYGVEIYPGDVIGSGTVGTGCYLEINGTKTLESKSNDIAYDPVWLQEGDIISLEIENLGILKNTIKKSSNNYSILSKKKLN